MEIKTQIRLEQCSKSFKDKKVLDDISVPIEAGNFMSILGQTGSGKTSLARLIAGLEKPDAGRIFLDEKLASSPGKIHIPPHERKMGFIFQDLALWPHLTVYENVEFGLKVSEAPNLRESVFSVLNRFGIEQLKDRYPNKLSGGQQQLVALARSIALHPSTLIMDEPMAGLDVKLKRSIRKIVKDLQSDGLTIIYVTHDHREAFELSNKIVLLNNGRIEALGSPDEIRTGGNQFAMDFLEID